MKRVASLFILAACLAMSCMKHEADFAETGAFKVLSVKLTDVALADGTLNPDVQLMGDEGPDTKLAVTSIDYLVSDLLGCVMSNSLIHISGTYLGRDIDGSPLTLSGKLLIPRDGAIKNMVIVSHYTIGSNRECPSESFPLEGILAAKGYAVVMADYIGYGVTVQRIHPYMHVFSTASSVIDMALAVKPYLESIGRKPESEEVYLMGYSQGGSTTLGVMREIQRYYSDRLPVRKVFAGGGPYDLAATYDTAMEEDHTGIPCAIPMIVQGINEGEHLGLDLADFFQPKLLENYREWINSKQYTVGEIDKLIGARALSEIMTPTGRDRTSPKTASLYRALMFNSVLNFIPAYPIYLFHSMDDGTVPFINAMRAEEYFKGRDITFDFGHYGSHGMGAVYFITSVARQL